MKNKRKTKILLGAVAVFGILALSGCSANFCSDVDKSHIAYAYEQGVTVYCDQADVPADYAPFAWQVYGDNATLYAYIPVDNTGNFAAKKAALLNSTISSAISSGYVVPTQTFWKTIDQKVLDAAIAAAGVSTATVTAAQINAYTEPDCNGGEGTTINPDSILRNFGYLKFLGLDDTTGEPTLYSNLDRWVSECRASDDADLGLGGSPSADFYAAYKTAVNRQISSISSCITTVEGRQYGAYGANKDWSVNIEYKSWKYAWKQGFFAGLISYPVAALLDKTANAFDPTLSGAGQLLALVLVTILVRVIILLITFKGTLDQQKMQLLQPEISKIQAKYPNSNENRSQKMRMSQEMNALYKRNKVSPFSSILFMIIQFPIFIGVWGAFRGSAALSTGSVLGLHLSDTISKTFLDFSGKWYLNDHGWWTAVILFIIMVGSQFVAMKLPQWLAKRRTKKQSKLTANPAQDKSQNTMKTVGWFMFVITAVMGLTLPSAMGVYWAIGAVISVAQTLIIQSINAAKAKKKRK